MDNTLNEIIKADELARRRLEQAEQYRRQRLAQLPELKEKIKAQEIEKAVEEVSRRKDKNRSAGEKQIDSLKKRNRAAEDKMREHSERHAREWVENIVKNVTTP